MEITKTKSLLAGGMLATAIMLAGCSDDGDKADNNDAGKTEQPAQTEEQHVVVHGDIINSHLVEDAVCVVNSRFEQGDRLVFRASVNDADTGKLIEDANVKVKLQTGDEFEMELIPHGEEGTLLYSYAWTIPDDYPTGTLDYEYVAEVGGKDYTYKPFDVSLSKLTIVEPGQKDMTAAAAGAEAEEKQEKAKDEAEKDQAEKEKAAEDEGK